MNVYLPNEDDWKALFERLERVEGLLGRLLRDNTPKGPENEPKGDKWVMLKPALHRMGITRKTWYRHRQHVVEWVKPNNRVWVNMDSWQEYLNKQKKRRK